MNTIYELEIKDDEKKRTALRSMFVERFKSYVPVPYDPDKKYLICHENGSLIGFSNSIDNSQKLARNWILDKGERGAIDVNNFSSRSANHHYYVIELYPGAYWSWSKKYRLFYEELTPDDEDAGFSAEEFYNKDYLDDFKKIQINSHIEASKAEEVRQQEETSSIFTQLFWVLIILMWILGGFSWLEP